MTDDERRELEVALLEIEHANERRRVRTLLAAAACALVSAGIALLLDWQTEEHRVGVSASTGYDAAPQLAWVMGAIALVLVAVGYWQVGQPGWAGWAVVPCGIAAVACFGTFHAGKYDRFGGPAGWLALAGFVLAGVLATLAATLRHPPSGPEYADPTADALKRIQRATSTQ